MEEYILVVDDDNSVRSLLEGLLTDEGYRVKSVESGDKALEIIKNQAEPELEIIDYWMPGMDGLKLMAAIRMEAPGVEIIMLTACEDWKTAVTAMKQGAFEYLTKPFKYEEVLTLVDKALNHKKMRDELAYWRDTAYSIHFGEFVGESPPMQKLYNSMQRVAENLDATVLITGESGTGKELVARTIHRLSSRSDMPFVAVNCTAIPESLLEAELFGYEKGAFTDAKSRKRGYFELADGGVMFIDEIGEMPLSTQAKLLRILEDKKVVRLGGVTQNSIDFRVIAATNKDLKKEVKAGRFREDFFFRLNVLPLFVPPLRIRGNDILLLAHHFLDKFRGKREKKFHTISDAVSECFLVHSWPGNVRELANMIERIGILHDSEILKMDHIPEDVRKQTGNLVDTADKVVDRIEDIIPEGDSFRQARKKVVEEFERKAIESLLKTHGGNIQACANAAKVNITSFRKLMNKYEY